MNNIEIIGLNPENAAKYGCSCFLNPKHEAHQRKLDWLKDRFSEGLKFKLLFLVNEKKSVGFIEYVPGEYAWRAVDASGYMFIHCMWISPNKYKNKGFGSLLVTDCIRDAENEGKYGVAVVSSEGSFMAGKALFLKNGFQSVASAEPSFELMVKTLKEGPLPKFRDWEKQLEKYKGLNIVYSKQCPWVIRSIKELCEIAEKKGLKLEVTELKTAKEAQNAPSIYATFNLIYDGEILADHYISNRRFLNIIDKEIQKK